MMKRARRFFAGIAFVLLMLWISPQAPKVLMQCTIPVDVSPSSGSPETEFTVDTVDGAECGNNTGPSFTFRQPQPGSHTVSCSLNGCPGSDDYTVNGTGTTSSVCGNNQCESGENNQNCPSDCSTATCGNSICESGENTNNCSQDCGTTLLQCGNGTCTSDENMNSCPADCTTAICGNNACELGENANSCNQDCDAVCGNSVCEAGETSNTCESDCIRTRPRASQCEIVPYSVVNVRTLPTTESEDFDTITSDTRYVIEGQRREGDDVWYRVVLPSGERGWIAAVYNGDELVELGEGCQPIDLAEIDLNFTGCQFNEEQIAFLRGIPTVELLIANNDCTYLQGLFGSNLSAAELASVPARAQATCPEIVRQYSTTVARIITYNPNSGTAVNKILDSLDDTNTTGTQMCDYMRAFVNRTGLPTEFWEEYDGDTSRIYATLPLVCTTSMTREVYAVVVTQLSELSISPRELRNGDGCAVVEALAVLNGLDEAEKLYYDYLTITCNVPPIDATDRVYSAVTQGQDVTSLTDVPCDSEIFSTSTRLTRTQTPRDPLIEDCPSPQYDWVLNIFDARHYPKLVSSNSTKLDYLLDPDVELLVRCHRVARYVLDLMRPRQPAQPSSSAAATSTPIPTPESTPERGSGGGNPPSDLLPGIAVLVAVDNTTQTQSVYVLRGDSLYLQSGITSTVSHPRLAPGGRILVYYALDRNNNPASLNRYDIDTGQDEVIWDTSGTGFAIRPTPPTWTATGDLLLPLIDVQSNISFVLFVLSAADLPTFSNLAGLAALPTDRFIEGEIEHISLASNGNRIAFDQPDSLTGRREIYMRREVTIGGIKRQPIPIPLPSNLLNPACVQPRYGTSVYEIYYTCIDGNGAHTYWVYDPRSQSTQSVFPLSFNQSNLAGPSEPADGYIVVQAGNQWYLGRVGTSQSRSLITLSDLFQNFQGPGGILANKTITEFTWSISEEIDAP